MKTLDAYLQAYNLVLTDDSGSEISRPKDIFYNHTGIILGKNKYTNKKMVFHNHPDSGPSIVTLEKFSNNFKCHYTNRNSDSWELVLSRSFEQIEYGVDYKMMEYNCQDATSYSREGVSSSEGRKNTVAALGIIATLFLISKF